MYANSSGAISASSRTSRAATSPACLRVNRACVNSPQNATKAFTPKAYRKTIKGRVPAPVCALRGDCAPNGDCSPPTPTTCLLRPLARLHCRATNTKDPVQSVSIRRAARISARRAANSSRRAHKSRRREPTASAQRAASTATTHATGALLTPRAPSKGRRSPHST